MGRLGLSRHLAGVSRLGLDPRGLGLSLGLLLVSGRGLSSLRLLLVHGGRLCLCLLLVRGSCLSGLSLLMRGGGLSRLGLMLVSGGGLRGLSLLLAGGRGLSLGLSGLSSGLFLRSRLTLLSHGRASGLGGLSLLSHRGGPRLSRGLRLRHGLRPRGGGLGLTGSFRLGGLSLSGLGASGARGARLSRLRGIDLRLLLARLSNGVGLSARGLRSLEPPLLRQTSGLSLGGLLLIEGVGLSLPGGVGLELLLPCGGGLLAGVRG